MKDQMIMSNDQKYHPADLQLETNKVEKQQRPPAAATVAQISSRKSLSAGASSTTIELFVPTTKSLACEISNECIPSATFLGDGICHPLMSTEACCWDGGGCIFGNCIVSPECAFSVKLGDGTCNADANTEACCWDGGDCKQEGFSRQTISPLMWSGGLLVLLLIIFGLWRWRTIKVRQQLQEPVVQEPTVAATSAAQNYPI